MYRNIADYPDILSVEETMKLLRVGRLTVYGLIRSGEVNAVKLGKGYKIAKASIIKIFEK